MCEPPHLPPSSPPVSHTRFYTVISKYLELLLVHRTGSQVDPELEDASHWLLECPGALTSMSFTVIVLSNTHSNQVKRRDCPDSDRATPSIWKIQEQATVAGEGHFFFFFYK